MLLSNILMLQVERKRLRQVNEMNAFIIIKKMFNEINRINVFIRNAGSNKVGGTTSSFAALASSSAYGSSPSSFPIPLKEVKWLRAWRTKLSGRLELIM